MSRHCYQTDVRCSRRQKHTAVASGSTELVELSVEGLPVGTDAGRAERRFSGSVSVISYGKAMAAEIAAAGLTATATVAAFGLGDAGPVVASAATNHLLLALATFEPGHSER